MNDEPQPSEDERLAVEGLAAQLCWRWFRGGPWWHVLREDIKERFRGEARDQLAKFKEDPLTKDKANGER